MRFKLMIAALTAASLGTALPAGAEAQSYSTADRYDSRYNANEFWRDAPRDAWQRITYLQRRIDRGVADGTLTRGEARRAQQQLNVIRRDAQRLRTRGGYMSAANNDRIQVRLDNLSQRVRLDRNNDRFATNYDATRDYRDDPRYQERVLSANDQVYRGSDGRYYCKRSDGTTGLIVGAAAGGLLGNLIDGGRNRVGGTLIGGALGALAGRSVEQSQVRCR